MAFMDGLSNGIGNAVDAIDRVCTNIMLVLIVIAIVLTIIAFRTSKLWFKVLFRILAILFIIICIFCFQHEVGLYKTGTALLIVTVVGVIATFIKKEPATD